MSSSYWLYYVNTDFYAVYKEFREIVFFSRNFKILRPLLPPPQHWAAIGRSENDHQIEVNTNTLRSLASMTDSPARRGWNYCSELGKKAIFLSTL